MSDDTTAADTTTTADVTPPAPPAADAKQIVEAAPTQEPQQPAPSFDFAAEVKRWAGDDKAKLNSLRYKSLDDTFNALVEAKKRIRDGSVKKPLGENATEEEIAEYRAANGIPEKPEDYLKALPDGLVVGDEDKPVFESVLNVLHKKNADPSIVGALVAWHHDYKQQEEARFLENNTAAKLQAEDMLTDEWGNNFTANKNIITNLVGAMPENLVGTQEEPGPLWLATLPDGTQLMNNPNMLRWLAKIGHDIHTPTTITSQGQPQGKSVDDRIAELVRLSGDHSGPYWKGPQAAAMQAELRDLNQKKLKMAS